VEAKVPPLDAGVVALLKAAKPDLMKALEYRAAAKAASLSEPPVDCGYVWPVTGIQRWTAYDEFGVETTHAQLMHGEAQSRWALAVQGLPHFVSLGFGDQACLMGWSKDELYRVPELWSQVHLTGAALLIDDRRVLAITADNIVVATRSGSTLKFRRIGREHLA
jgi:hypothetical protein